jgi:hypothetical protein
MTRAATPYEGISNSKLRQYLDSGMRLPQPTHCPDAIYDIQRQCWCRRADERPTFDHLTKRLRGILRDNTPNPYVRVGGEQYLMAVMPGRIYTNFFACQLLR